GGLSAKDALMLVWRRGLESNFFQNMTKNGVAERVALRETLLKAGVTPDEYPFIFEDVRDANETMVSA
ncbi:hypothetical protein, partial [Vibrio anguillarum]